jgi:hypothetical protein
MISILKKDSAKQKVCKAPDFVLSLGREYAKGKAILIFSYKMI